MSPLEDNVPEQEQALVTITDLLGIRAPATELVRAISKGVGSVFEPWLRRRNAKVDLANYNDWRASLVDTDELPSSFEFSIGDRAAIRLQNDVRRRQLNRERIAVEAIENYRASEPNRRDESDRPAFDDDWLNFFWRAAEEVSSRDMQSLWGCVLARQALGHSQYQLRTLDFLRTLSRSEAEDIGRLAGYASYVCCRYGTGVGIIDTLGRLGRINDQLSATNEAIKKCIGDWKYGHLGSIGFYIESGWAYAITVDKPEDHIMIGIADKTIQVSGDFFVHSSDRETYLNIGSGVQISPVGVEILTLTRANANPEYLELISQGLVSQGLRVEPG